MTTVSRKTKEQQIHEREGSAWETHRSPWMAAMQRREGTDPEQHDWPLEEGSLREGLSRKQGQPGLHWLALPGDSHGT